MSLIPRVINHLHRGLANGTLIAPFWPSAPFWPMLFSDNSVFKTEIVDVLVFEKGRPIFIQHLNRKISFWFR